MCGSSGKTFLRDVPELFFARNDGSRLWSFRRCSNDGFVWLTPRPDEQTQDDLYSDYYTHAPTAGAALPRFLSRSMYERILKNRFGYPFSRPSGEHAPAFVPRLTLDTAAATVMWLPYVSGGRLLDIGAGNGDFLARMKRLGWETVGVETDVKAAAYARSSSGADIVEGTVFDAAFDEKTFDAIALNHVVEHVDGVSSLLHECRRLLKPGGRVAILTPNAASLGSRLLKHSWRGWEAPRHLQLFTPGTLNWFMEKADFEIDFVRTTTRAARHWYFDSRAARWGRDLSLSRRIRLNAERFTFQAVEGVATRFADCGEEVVLVARCPEEGS
jgi:2-polyprenyl-3-methyl-5-hydroxy-6-metoxy-1,4-benzoquinol methylase